MTETIPEMIPFSYVLAVRNLRRTTVWFRDVLGFELMWPEGGGEARQRAGHARGMPGGAESGGFGRSQLFRLFACH